MLVDGLKVDVADKGDKIEKL